MGLKTFKLLKTKRNSSEKRVQAEQKARKLEYRLELELMDKLEQYLESNDRVMFEVNEKCVGEFINILNSRVLSMYEYEQYDKNKFIFYNKQSIL